MRKLLIAIALSAAAVFGTAAPAFANPGPGNSFQCAPGQHDGNGSNDSAVDHCPNQK
jgi:hypothetical protein